MLPAGFIISTTIRALLARLKRENMMADSIFNENMSSSEARLALFSAVDGKTRDEIEALFAEYDKVARIISKREFKLAEEGWFID